MVEHLIVQGGEQYLPFARSAIARLRATGVRHATQGFDIEGVSIRVKITPGADFIWITGGIGDKIYEFFTTGSDLNPNAGVGGFSDSLNPPGSVTRVYQSKDKDPVFYPLWSSLHAPDTEKPKWPLVDRKWWAENHIRLSGNVYSDNYACIFSQPSEHFGSQQSYYQNKADDLITSCRAFGPGASYGPIFSATSDLLFKCGIVPGTRFACYSYGVVPDVVLKVDPWLKHTDRVFTQYGSYVVVAAYAHQYPYTWLDSRISAVPLWRGLALGSSSTTDIGQGTLLGVNAPPDLTHVQDSMRFSPESTAESSEANIFDIPPARYKGGNINVGAGRQDPYAHWRTGAILRVRDVNDKVITLFVLTDTHNGFMFFEAQNYASTIGGGSDLGSAPTAETYRNLSPDKWVRVVPKMPSWVSMPTEGQKYKERTWLWRFNKSGTRAVSTPVSSKVGVYGGLDNVSVLDSSELYGIPRVTPEIAGIISDYLNSLPANSRPPQPISGSAALFVKSGGKYYFAHKNGPDMTEAVRDHVVPINDVSPGVVEVDVDAKITYDNKGKMIITPSVTVRFHDHFSISGKVYADAAYYIATERARSTSNSLDIVSLPKDDDLLAAEIVVKGRQYKSEYTGEVIEKAAVFPAFGYAFYAVNNLSRNELVTTLCLGAQLQFGKFIMGDQPIQYNILPEEYHYGDPPVPYAIFFSAILAHDLRYLSFVTATYYRRRCMLSALRASEPGGGIFRHIHGLLPRIELRIPGEQLRTVDYGKDVWSGYAGSGVPNSGLPSLKPDFSGYEYVPHTPPPPGSSDGDTIDYLYTGTAPGIRDYYSAGYAGLSDFGQDPLRTITPSVQDGFRLIRKSGTETQDIWIYGYSDETHQYPYYTGLITYHATWWTEDDPLVENPGSSFMTEERKQMFLPFVLSGQYYTQFSFTPTGDYAVYIDVRSDQFTVSPRSTEMSGVIDVIKMGTKYTSHLDAFNSAFEKTMSYADIAVDGANRPGRYGMGGVFMYKPPGKFTPPTKETTP